VAAAASVAVASHTDNMFMTANFDSACLDGGHFCRTDNAALTVYRGTGLSSTGRANIAWTLNNSWNTTDLNVSYHSSPVTSGGAETDIVYQHNPGRVPANLDGYAWCNDAVGPQECDQHYVAFRSVSPSRGLACHETGHAVGLTHGQNASPRVSQTNAALACMTTPVQSDLVGSHNVGQVNSHY
jgi:hypothetical protein